MTVEIDGSDQERNRASGYRGHVLVSVGAVLFALILVVSLDLTTLWDLRIYPAQVLSLVLALLIPCGFLKFGRIPPNHSLTKTLINSALALLAFGVFLIIAFSYPNAIDSVYQPTPAAVVLGVLAIALILEAIRRTLGFPLFLIIGVFLVYAFTAQYWPGPLRGKPQGLSMLASYLAFDDNGILGIPLRVSVAIVLPFLVFGGCLVEYGGGQYFLDLALRLMGRKRGGTMKIAVLASALFGTISGSAVANVASTGVISIPMNKRVGFSATDAAAVESVAATGGQLMPPVMGAAAFLMAEFLNVSYATVALAAALPAVFYYLSLFIQVDGLAIKTGIKGLDASELPKWSRVLKGSHYLIAFLLLIYLMFFRNMPPEEAALYSAALVLITGWLFGYVDSYRDRKAPARILRELTRASYPLIAICAGAGIIIGVLSVTGLSFTLTMALLTLGNNSTLLLLALSAIICIILGMGLPTLAVYVLLATLIAPSLIEVGINPIGAHLFVMYFGMMSMITPPVCIAVFTAAGIADSKPMRTGLHAVRYGWLAFVIPFLFVYSPELLLVGSTNMILLVCALTACGVIIIGMGLSKLGAGVLKKRVVGLLLLAIGILVLWPVNSHGMLELRVVVGLGMMGLWLVWRARKRRTAGQRLVET